jgi:hypothetical protein
VLPTKFKKTTATENSLESSSNIKRAIRNHRGRVDFPTVLVEARASLWVTSQRFSMFKNKHDDIGHFEQPVWLNLAKMNDIKCDKYLQTLMKIVMDTYRRHWFFIMKQQSSTWVNDEHKALIEENFPAITEDVTVQLHGSMYVTSSRSIHARRLLGPNPSSVVAQTDKLDIVSSGTFG